MDGKMAVSAMRREQIFPPRYRVTLRAPVADDRSVFAWVEGSRPSVIYELLPTISRILRYEHEASCPDNGLPRRCRIARLALAGIARNQIRTRRIRFAIMPNPWE